MRTAQSQPVILIDTLALGGPRVGVAVAREVTWQSIASVFHASDRLLALLTRLLARRSVRLRDVRGVVAVTGPGGFTRVRAGVVLANALAYGCHVPLVSLPSDAEPRAWERAVAACRESNAPTRPLEPHYDAPPTITVPRARLKR